MIGFALALALLAAGTPHGAKAWGPEAHQMIADIAEAHLTPKAAKRVSEILQGARMRDVSNYADEIRPQRRDTRRWHYVNIKPGAADYVAERDCVQFDGEGDCIIAAIERALAEIRMSDERQREGLKLLIHFVGDLHQPFHAVAEERGGNQIRVMYRSRPTNLHAVWDSSLVREARRTPADYAKFIDQTQLRGADLEVLTSGTIVEWALESRDIGLGARVQSGTEIDEKYVASHVPQVEQQMALAGVRLAKLLNSALADH
jgi:hypothetical protein